MVVDFEHKELAELVELLNKEYIAAEIKNFFNSTRAIEKITNAYWESSEIQDIDFGECEGGACKL